MGWRIEVFRDGQWQFAVWTAGGKKDARDEQDRYLAANPGAKTRIVKETK